MRAAPRGGVGVRALKWQVEQCPFPAPNTFLWRRQQLTLWTVSRAISWSSSTWFVGRGAHQTQGTARFSSSSAHFTHNESMKSPLFCFSFEVTTPLHPLLPPPPSQHLLARLGAAAGRPAGACGGGGAEPQRPQVRRRRCGGGGGNAGRRHAHLRDWHGLSSPRPRCAAGPPSSASPCPSPARGEAPGGGMWRGRRRPLSHLPRPTSWPRPCWSSSRGSAQRSRPLFRAPALAGELPGADPGWRAPWRTLRSGERHWGKRGPPAPPLPPPSPPCNEAAHSSTAHRRGVRARAAVPQPPGDFLLGPATPSQKQERGNRAACFHELARQLNNMELVLNQLLLSQPAPLPISRPHTPRSESPIASPLNAGPPSRPSPSIQAPQSTTWR